MNPDRLLIFEQGLEECRKLLGSYPDSRALQSIKRQIEFLIDLERGVTHETCRLDEITIGILTAREVEPLDNEVAEIFYKVASAASRM